MNLPNLFSLSRILSLLPAVACLGAMPSRAADAPAPVAGDAPDTNAVPRIEFAERTFDFDKVTGGQAVRHDFYFTNTGNAVLKITSVNTACGCTTAGEYTRELAPGAVGKIPLQFNSGNFSGPISKTASVGCNDPAASSLLLTIKGTVWRPIEIVPQMAMLNVNSELVSNATAVVRITNHAPEPLEVFEPMSSNPQFAAEVRTNAPGKLFEVVVRSVPPLNPTNPQGVITVKTSSTNTPTVSISAMCVAQPAVIVSPPRVVIPEGRLTDGWTGQISIVSGLNRPLSVSDATVNLPGAQADLRELEPGRSYEVTLVVPPAARIATEPLALKLKSNYADYETIQVPILVVNASNSVTAQGIPLTARASRFINTPPVRKPLVAIPPRGHEGHNHGPGEHEGHDHGPEAVPAPVPPVSPK